MRHTSRIFPLMLLLLLTTHQLVGQAVLPPVMEWHGKSESLIVNANHPWITPTEKADFVTTPNYELTMSWLKKLTDASPLLTMISIGQSVEGRDIYMVIASSEKDISTQALQASKRPLLLAQAGIHSGEIDGKDAGMMLLRDIAFGNRKKLIDQVNFLFIPILSVDAHERSSPFNRPNQRGPQNMGWRTNAQNLNLNRDYSKLDTREVRAVVQVINAYDPDVYMDLHVTDGADYQYDITFGGYGIQGNSPGIALWLDNVYKPAADQDLKAYGHIPGQLIFATNDRDFSEGNTLLAGGPRYSDAYGNLRHMASVLVENHSLKPFKQRVLGTYVLLESTLKLLATGGQSLQEITQADRALRPKQLPMDYVVPQMQPAVAQSTINPPDSLDLLGITSQLKQSPVTNAPYVEWLGQPITQRIANYKGTEPINRIVRPKGYWIPASCEDVIARLQMHGVQLEIITEPHEVTVEMYRIQDAQFGSGTNPKPFEGRMMVRGTTQTEIHQQVFSKNSAFVPTDQDLGDLAMILLEPSSQDSFFSWGFFLSIFQRTEYIEDYVIAPMAENMLQESPALQLAFEAKKAADPAFAENPEAILSWFYSQTKYYDDRYLLYPIGREL